jgi:hypothetical protein
LRAVHPRRAGVELARTVVPGRSSPAGGSQHDWGKLAGAAMLGRGRARRCRGWNPC